ncbi:methyl-accepting chemotaxis protein [Paracidovorax konjaci]|uniref:Methyl-accepting chemotaxis protein n=1 Tax=Paracidovorax konjaci TaxID=32040 RepID=A0A1I1WPZ2_9BURK|nr:methyl-accepting chemotaxis protein [Paracidovorax konjaci]
MKFMTNINLGTMLGMGFFAVIAFSFLVAAYGRIQLGHVSENIQTLSEDRLGTLLRLQ